ncbi:MAG: TolC family protein [Polyangiaceae bacterium]|nr:TolC family protein [Polyangiaceae bacterium]
MSQRILQVLLVGVALTVSVGGWAANAEAPAPRGQLSLQQALRLLERSPWLEVDRASEGLARAEVRGASAYPNPTLSYSGALHAHGRDTFDGSVHQLMVEQPVLLGGQRGARLRAADASVRASRARTEQSRHELAVELRRRFIEALAAEERTRILRRGAADLERVTEVVRGRFEAGDRSEYDVIRIETALLTMNTNVAESDAEALAAAFDVAVLLGRADSAPRVIGDLLPLAPAQLGGPAGAEHPAERMAALSVDARRGALEAARRERSLVPSIAAGVQSTTRDYGSALVVGVALPLPLFDRAQGPIAQASAEHHLASAEQRAVRATLTTQRARARHVLTKRREALLVFEREALPRAARIRELAEESYRDGQTSVLELMDALDTVRELRLEHLERRVAVKHAEIDVMAVAGTALAAR